MQLLFFSFLILFTSLCVCSSDAYHLLKPTKPNHDRHRDKPQESIELIPPLSTANLPPPPPKCRFSVIRRRSSASITVPYSQPSACPPPWSHTVLHLYGAVSGNQDDSIASVWLGGCEILRTSTPEAFNSGTFWNVQKDITRYSSLLQKSNIFLTMMLENHRNGMFAGIHHVNLTILFYKQDKVVVNDGCWQSKLGIWSMGLMGGVGGYEKPADLVIPVTAEENGGFWFRIEDESSVASKNVGIPMNAFRIVLELYVSFHGDDEFWYANPPTRYIVANNLTTKQGNGPFREIYVRVDGNYVASEVPFPIVFPGGVNPLFWKPVVAIGAFNMPSYEFDLTPFLGSLLDGKPHNFELGVVHAIPYWLVDANLHIWLERGSTKVEAKMSFYQPPQFRETTEYSFNQLNGRFKTEAKRSSMSSGWVAVSCGNLSMTIARKVKLKNSIMFRNNGLSKMVKQHIKVKIRVRVLSDMGIIIARRKFKGKYPLKLTSSTMPGPENDTSLVITNISVGLKEKFYNGGFSSTVRNNLQSGGWMLVKGRSVLLGIAETQQSLNYRDKSGCFLRSVGATKGKLEKDDSTTVCPSLFRKVLNLFFGN